MPRLARTTLASCLVAGLVVVLGGCRAEQSSDGPLDAREAAAARAAVARVVTDQDTVTSATYTVREARIPGGNTGHPCTSGTVVVIRVLGTFPDIQTTGHPVAPGEPQPDFTVGGLRLTADRGATEPCLVSVQTLEDGPLHQPEDAWTLDLPLRG